MTPAFPSSRISPRRTKELAANYDVALAYEIAVRNQDANEISALAVRLVLR